ncbi:DNA topoisomerase IV, alpha subunit [Mollisia scopiformis]|uniref:DNA topoisomerase (ATP-hydrolyzing) n=1 Tax=Mollisia scopiformis TaxID=149040 RepID=A0A194XBD0_MOLSC|nr:DNA topoisomerase IV, alpha subunit [Mollisia scopiformis]KUJ17464.1 DNA topoisomerase IV, alpha subunit [Mollisia scopiformis]
MDIDLLSDTPEENQLLLLPNVLPHLPSTLITEEPSEFLHENLLHTEISEPDVSALSVPAADAHQSVITKIEVVFESIADCILSGRKELEIQLKSRTTWKETAVQNGVDGTRPKKSHLRKIKFPSKCPIEAWRFTVLCRILELSHEALISGVVTTKRDIYYRESELFTKQSIVDRYVDDIAYTFGINRDALNVAAAAKGLMIGNLSVTKRGGHRIEYWSEPEGILIPKSDDLEDVYLGGTRWIVVVEKEATFRSLAACRYWQNCIAGNGILITAKGYPDIQTRQFLHFLATRFPRIPIYALVDFDPDGIGIMSTYKHGSKALAHEKNVAVPSLHWLGIRSLDFTTDDSVQGLLSLTKRDRNIAKKMLARQDVETGDQEWRRELQMMLMLNMKAEIQILGNEDKLSIWLDRKLSEAVYDADGDISMSQPE